MEPRRRILLVDDHATTRRMLRIALEQANFEVLEAKDGHAALMLMQSERPVLVVQDLILPDVDGFALAGRLRALAGQGPVRILACSGLVSNLDAKRISSVGFDDVVEKPVSPSRLVALVEAHFAELAPAREQLGSGKRLLVVDDDPIQLRLVCHRLERLGFAVEEAHDGQEALAIASRSVPDAIVSDVLMPRLDGFGLAVALRADPSLASVPLVLLTASYLEASDRELGRRAGADAFVLRTPDLGELTLALRTVLARGRSRPAAPPAETEALQREHERRMVRQLERQLIHGTELMRRCSQLSAELSILTSLSEAVLQHRDVESALITSLATCFDAGNSSFGALYLLDKHQHLRVRALGVLQGADGVELSTFFGYEAWLRALMQAGTHVLLTPGPDGETSGPANEVLARAHARRALIVPLVHLGVPLGALFMAMRDEDRAIELDQWRVFAQGVGNQITQALALAEAFREREVAEREAEQQKRFTRDQAAVWRALVEHAPDVIVHLDTNAQVRFINRPPPGLSPERLRRATWFDLMPPECHDDMRAALAIVLEQGIAQTLENCHQDAGGIVTWIESHLGPIFAGSEVTGALVIQRDVSLKKQTEAQLIIADRMASVGALAAGVAHELNNPLASVLANLEVAQRDVETLDGSAPAELREELRDAFEGAERVRRIVQDLRIFSRADEERRAPVDVPRVLDSALRMAWNELRYRARVVKDYRAVPPVEASEAQLGQLFLNLIVNAAHAVPEGAAEHNRVTVYVGAVDSQVVVRIEDTGCGIASDQKARIFTPFYTTKPKGVGTGVGLTICHRIVSALGGSITVDTEPGRGSRFEVRLPACCQPAAAGGGPVRAERPVRRGSVLVLDDELLITQAVRRTLTPDHDVLALDHAEEALRRIQGGERFDVIICDLLMPQMSGMDFYAELAKACTDQAERVVFFTGGAFTRGAREFLDSVPNMCMEKPIDGQELRALVNGLVR